MQLRTLPLTKAIALVQRGRAKSSVQTHIRGSFIDVSLAEWEWVRQTRHHLRSLSRESPIERLGRL
jgi:hypothetical protein